MKNKAAILALVLTLPLLAFSADYNLGDLARTRKLDLFNRTLDPSKAGLPEAIFLDAAAKDGLAWLIGVEVSDGTIELEIKGRDRQGQSFVGLAFRGQDNQTFDAIYLRPFNFRSSDLDRQSHSIQYVSMPGHDWSNLRGNHPGKYESALTPAPAPDDWVKLRIVIQGKSVSAFVNGSEKPALQVDLLSGQLKGKLGLWVGNGSDGWFRNLKLTPATK